MYETEVAQQKYINVLLGSLDTPNEIFLIECLPVKSSSNVICWSQYYSTHCGGRIATSWNQTRKFFIALIDTYISLAGGKTLKRWFSTFCNIAKKGELIVVKSVHIRVVNRSGLFESGSCSTFMKTSAYFGPDTMPENKLLRNQIILLPYLFTLCRLI